MKLKRNDFNFNLVYLTGPTNVDKEPQLLV